MHLSIHFTALLPLLKLEIMSLQAFTLLERGLFLALGRMSNPRRERERKRMMDGLSYLGNKHEFLLLISLSHCDLKHLLT